MHVNFSCVREKEMANTKPISVVVECLFKPLNSLFGIANAVCTLEMIFMLD